MLGNVGSFFKKGWGVVSSTTKETATKIGNTKVGQSVKTGFNKAADATVAGVKVGYEKSKEFGTKVAAKTVEVGGKVKNSVVLGFVSEA